MRKGRKNLRVTNADVVVIGGGLAGLTAALAAKDESLEVALLCKSKTGKSGNTLVSGAALCVAGEEGRYGDSPGLLEKDILDSGAGINDPVLVKIFAEESTAVLASLREYGVKFKNIDGVPLVKQPPGHSVKRSFPSEYSAFTYTNRGLALMTPLLGQAVSRGVRIVDDTTVIKLLTNQYGVCGAVAMDNRTGDISILRAGVVVLAAGGGCTLFSSNNNTADVSCDSYKLAYEAGAMLRDMEMVQFYPTMMYEPTKIPISNPLFGEGAVLKNIRGEEFLYRYSEKGNCATRDMMARAVKMEIDAGRGNPRYVFVDCSEISEDVLDKRYEELSHTLKKVGLDIKKDLLPVAPSAHFYIGGVCIDGECKTSVDGLLACGEAAGGLHGANRLSGIALAEAAVFGKIAGQTASRLCKAGRKTDVLPEIEFSRPGKRRGDIKIRDIIRSVRETMWRNASIVKSEESLNTAKVDVENVMKMLDSTEMASTDDVLCYHRLHSMLVAARMLITGSLFRKETRGAFCRSEYSESAGEFTGTFFLKKDTAGEIEGVFKRTHT